ncbi:MAG: molybdopterin dehydrogenase, FAD-binding [Planctomycetaceae bacterium]|nr:molybdopterin dehydrogenase, FAD-binding [Planctomycetaceae bacterium]
MELFSYARVDNAAAAVKQVAEHEHAKFLGGGTNLLDYMKLDVETPKHLVDINSLPLNQIEVTDSGVRIGALVRNTELAYHEAIRQKYPVLSEALLAGATPQIRNMATVGGNLLQRTRCTYFRDTCWSCNKRQPGSGCAALEGYNRSHAILGTSDKCIATHPSDMCVALCSLDAVVETLGPQGKRRIPLNEFYVAYGTDPAKENVLQGNELIVAVELPNAGVYAHSHYLKVRDRASFEFALVSVAAALEIHNGKIAGVRLALGGVATKPWRATEAETALVGQAASEAEYLKAANVALQNAKPQKHNGFKIELTRRAIVRTLTELTAPKV